MTTKNTQIVHTIDAAGQSLGRVASAAAKVLMGKTSPDYTPNVRSKARVEISNASKLNMRERKTVKKSYTTYSGYPGGLKSETYAQLTARRGYAEAIRRAVERMLPRNTMRTDRMKNLIVTE